MVKVLGKFLNEIDTVLYGRVSYEAWGNYIPAENSSAFEKDFYNKLNGKEKYVFSLSKDNFPGNPIVVKSDIKETISHLKQQPGKNIWLYGGAGLISTFVNSDLIDEFRIAVFPIILGSGRSLFNNIDHRVKLKLIDAKAGQSGVVEFKYERTSDCLTHKNFL